MFSFVGNEKGAASAAAEVDARIRTRDAKNEEAVWVFGYGSLCWFPGFEFKESALGCVTGFKRRFWQGNATHRGTAMKPGRVATVVEEKEGVVWGRAFLVTGDAALPYLNQRECKLGGYATRLVTFHPYDSKSSSQPRNIRVPSKKSLSPSTSTESSLNTAVEYSSKGDSFALNLLERLKIEEENSKKREPLKTLNDLTALSLARFFAPGCDSGYSSPKDEEPDDRMKPFPVLMYIATEENCHWLGKAPLHSIAEQIAECHGPSGSNADYLLNLARFMRTELPTVKDDHLFELERLVRERLAARGQRVLADVGGAVREEQKYTSRLPSKKLRCLNI